MVATINALRALIVRRRFPKTRGVKRHGLREREAHDSRRKRGNRGFPLAEPKTGTICRDVIWNFYAILVVQESIGKCRSTNSPCGIARFKLI